MQIRRTAATIILVLILFLQVGLRLPFIQVPLERDEGAYGYVAQRVLAGELPYRDAFDHKPPLVYYLYASWVKLFGNTIAAIRIPTLGYSLLTTVALFYLGFLWLGMGGGLLAAFLYAVFSGAVMIQGASANTETFMVLPLILALVFYIKGARGQQPGSGANYFLAGLFSGIAIMFKQVAAVNFLVLLLFLFDHNKRFKFDLKNAAGLVAGCLLVPLFFVFYFTYRGALSDFIYDVFLVNRIYFRSLPFGPLARLAHGFYTTFIIANLENSIIWMFGIIGLLYIFVRDRASQSLLLAFWALASVFAVAVSGLFFGHYYIQLIPALCLLSAYAMKRIVNKAGFLLKTAIVLLSLFLILAVIPYQYPIYFKFSPDQISEYQYGKLSYVISYRLAQKLKQFMRPEEEILVWAANPEVYFYLNKKAPTRYFNYLGWMENKDSKQEVVSSILRARPDYIVWTNYTCGYKRLVDYVRQNYRPFMKIDQWQVFKRVR